MHLGAKCISFGAAFHLGFGQCPAVGGRGVKHMDLFPNIPFPFLFLFLFLPLLQEFTFILMISLVYFTFHMFYLGTSMLRSRLSFFPPDIPQDNVALSQTMCSLSPGPKVQIVFGNWFNSDGQSQILPQFFLPIVIYFRAT